MKKTPRVEPRWFATVIFFLIGALFGGFIAYLYTQATLPNWIKSRLAPGDYQYINTLSVLGASDNYGNYSSLNKDVQQQIATVSSHALQDKKITKLSIYYRDLGAG